MPELDDVDDLFPDEPAGEGDGSHYQAPIQLREPFRDLADFLAEEAQAELAGLNPSQTRFRVYIARDLTDEELEQGDDSNPLFGYAMAQTAKPVCTAGRSMLRYLQKITAVGDIAIEWLPPHGRKKILHYLHVPEAQEVQEPAYAGPREVIPLDRLRGGGNNELLLVLVEMMERKDAAAQQRLDIMMREMRESQDRLISTLRENDPMREIGASLARASNETLLEAVREQVASVRNKKSDTAELLSKFKELKEAQAEIGEILGTGEPDDDGGLGEIGQLVGLVQAFRGGGSATPQQQNQVQNMVNQLGGKGEGILDSA